MRLRFSLCLLAALFGAACDQNEAGRKYYYEDILERFFVPDQRDPGFYRSQRRGAVATPFPVAKPEGAFRVFITGDSNALRYGNDFQGPLQAALPSRKVELINCGMGGYDSFRALWVEQEILGYAPDLIIWIGGHTESPGHRPIPKWKLRAQELLGAWGLDRLSSRGQGRPREDRPDPNAPRVMAATLAENLREMIRASLRRAIPIALIVPPLNYSEMPPDRPLPADPAFMRGRVFLLQGNYGKAHGAFEKALGQESAPERPITLFFMGYCQEALGHFARSRRSFEDASFADEPFAGGCGRLCHETIRNAGREEGAIVVDLDRAFRDQSYPHLPGLGMLEDKMHWRRHFNDLLSSRIIAGLRRDPRLRALRWSTELEPGNAGWAKLKPSWTYEDRRTLRYALERLSRQEARGAGPRPGAVAYPFEKGSPDKTFLSPQVVFQLRAVHRRHPEWFSDIEGLVSRLDNDANRVGALWGMTPTKTSLPLLYWHMGEMLMLEKDYARAAASFATALRMDPSNCRFWLSQGLALGLSGDGNGALKSLGEARERASGGEGKESLNRETAAIAAALGLAATWRD